MDLDAVNINFAGFCALLGQGENLHMTIWGGRPHCNLPNRLLQPTVRIREESTINVEYF